MNPDDPRLRNLAIASAEHKRRADERRAEITALHGDGQSAHQIAEVIGLKVDTVRGILRDLGLVKRVAPHKPPMSPEEIEKARRMLEDGQSYHGVAVTLGRAQQTVERNVPGYGKLTPQESGSRAALVRSLHRLEKKL